MASLPAAQLPPLPESAPEPSGPPINPILSQAKSRLPVSVGSTPAPAAGGNARQGPLRLETEGFTRGAYDDRMLTAIYLQWIRLLGEHRIHEPFVVVVDFDQTADGAIRNLRAVTTDFTPVATADPSALPRHLCVESIQVPQPYGRWPESVRREIGADRRKCRISFHLIIVPH